MFYQLSSNEIWFPKPELAEEDGLLAVGGDLSPERLMLAYHHGIFPWYSDDSPILWYAPHERFVLFPGKLKVSSSMKKIFESGQFAITFNTVFAEVVASCASIARQGQDGTWITDEMKEAYIGLNQAGYAYSVETWQDERLVGGLYGVEVNQVFCGESMFSKVSNASKAALIWLCQHRPYTMIDCQVYTPHLESLGAEMISRTQYLEILGKSG
jgi:leucyl/phenylalanyl-tRNA--protein transferase